MKRLLSALLLLATLAVVAVFLWQLQRALPERSRGAELAPPETIFFAQLPNLRQTAQRFPQTGLYQLWVEPEVQAFLEKPRQKSVQFQQWIAQCERLAALSPGEAFVAVTSLEGAQPKFVAGISFAARKAQAEALLREARAQLQQRFPGAPAAVASYKNNEIETFSAAQGGLSECLRENWFFVSDDLTLLKATLDRCDSPAGSTGGTLAGDETFQKTIAPLGPALDCLIFAQLASLSERVGSLLAVAGPPAAAVKLERAPAIQAIASGTRLEGAQLRDLLFLLDPGHPAPAPIARSTVALAAADTLFYYATRLPKSWPTPDAGGVLQRFLPDLTALDPQLTARNLRWSDLGRTLGPELGTLLTWPEEAGTPSALLAVEVQNRAQTAAFLDAFRASTLGLDWVQTERDGVTFYQPPAAGLAMLQPTMALTDRFLLLGLNPQIVASSLRQLQAGAAGTAGTAGLTTSPGYLQAAGRLTAPTSGFGYLETGRLFDHAYGMARPFLSMSLALSSEAASILDAGKLPSAAALSRHLSPSTFSQSVTPDGTLLESTGTLTFNQLLLGIAGGSAAAALPTLQKTFPVAAQMLPATPTPAPDLLPTPPPGPASP